VTDLLAEAAIQQLNLGFDSEQDRLLLKVGLADDTELSVWLTRRMVKSLWLLLQGSADLNDANEHTLVIQEVPAELASEVLSAVNATLADASKPPLDFSTSYQANRTPIVDEPILAFHCGLVSHDDAHSILEIQAKDGKTIRIVLNVELLLALSNMLQLATKEAAWDLGFASSHFMMTDNSARPVIH
jgi:hypothetical protein